MESPDPKANEPVKRDVLREALIVTGVNPDARPRIKLTPELERHNALAIASQALLDEDYKTRYAEPGSMQKAFAEQFERIKAAAEGRDFEQDD